MAQTDTFEAAWQLHIRGEFRAAEQAYRRLLRVRPPRSMRTN